MSEDLFTPVGAPAKREIVGTHQGHIKDRELKKRRDAKSARWNARKHTGTGFVINSKGHRKSCAEFGQCLPSHHHKYPRQPKSQSPKTAAR